MWSWAGPSRLHSSYCAPCRRYTPQEPGNESLGLGMLIAPPQNSRLQSQTPVQMHLSSGETSNTGSVSAITEGKCGIFSHAYVCRTLAQDTETSFLPLPDGRSNLYSVIHFFSVDSSVFELESCLMQSKFQMSNVHPVELPRLWENAPFSSSDGRHQSTHLALQKHHCAKVHFTNIQDYRQLKPPLRFAKPPNSCFAC